MSVSHEAHSLKRDHDSFSFDDLTNLEQPFHVPPEVAATYSVKREEDHGEASMPTPPISVGNKTAPSPPRSRSASLTEPGSRTPSLRGDSPMPAFGQPLGSSSPSAFAALNGNGSAPPPAKKVKLTFAEKEMKRIQKEIKDQERAAEKARKEQERQAQAEDKSRREAEREAERKKKEAEREQKEAEKRHKEAEKKKREAEKEQKRAALEVEKAAKEEKKRRKEEEKQRAEEAKKKEQSKQKSLSSFFTIPATTVGRQSSVERRSESPAPASNPSLTAVVASPAATTPQKPEKTAYEKTFPDFYIYPNVTMAPINRFERDEEASESLHCKVDSYLVGNRSPGHPRDFDATTLFHLSGRDNVSRGKRFMSVREIMAEFSGKSTRPIDLTTDSQNTQIKRTAHCLKKVPLKFLKFQEDVRPPYRGTYTNQPVNGMAKLARNPMRRDLPDTNYDYDSEAEWIEDEDAEDLNSEGDEDEELGEDGEDMEGFLDDENDEIANSKRLVLQGDLEPVSTGLCWEDQRKRSTNVKMMPYRMEIILTPTMKSIDPFSTQYWEPTPAAASAMDPPRLPLNTLKSNSLTVNGASKPVKQFFTSASDVFKSKPTQVTIPTQSTPSIPVAGDGKPKKVVPAEDMPAFKQEIQGSNLSKVGLIEVLKKKFPGRSGAMIKCTLEIIAKRVGAKEADKRWVLVEDRAA